MYGGGPRRRVGAQYMPRETQSARPTIAAPAGSGMSGQSGLSLTMKRRPAPSRPARRRCFPASPRQRPGCHPTSRWRRSSPIARRVSHWHRPRHHRTLGVTPRHLPRRASTAIAHRARDVRPQLAALAALVGHACLGKRAAIRQPLPINRRHLAGAVPTGLLSVAAGARHLRPGQPPLSQPIRPSGAGHLGRSPPRPPPQPCPVLRVPCDPGITGNGRAPRQPLHLRDAQPRHARRRHPQGGLRRDGARGDLDRSEPGQGDVLARPHAGRRPSRILSTYLASHQQSPLDCSLRRALHTPHGADSPVACGDRVGIASTTETVEIADIWRAVQGIALGSPTSWPRCRVCGCVHPRESGLWSAVRLSCGPLMIPATAVSGGCAGGKWAKCGGSSVRPRIGRMAVLG